MNRNILFIMFAVLIITSPAFAGSPTDNLNTSDLNHFTGAYVLNSKNVYFESGSNYLKLNSKTCSFKMTRTTPLFAAATSYTAKGERADEVIKTNSTTLKSLDYSLEFLGLGCGVGQDGSGDYVIFDNKIPVGIIERPMIIANESESIPVSITSFDLNSKTMRISTTSDLSKYEKPYVWYPAVVSGNEIIVSGTDNTYKTICSDVGDLTIFWGTKSGCDEGENWMSAKNITVTGTINAVKGDAQGSALNIIGNITVNSGGNYFITNGAVIVNETASNQWSIKNSGNFTLINSIINTTNISQNFNLNPSTQMFNYTNATIFNATYIPTAMTLSKGNATFIGSDFQSIFYTNGLITSGTSRITFIESKLGTNSAGLGILASVTGKYLALIRSNVYTLRYYTHNWNANETWINTSTIMSAGGYYYTYMNFGGNYTYMYNSTIRSEAGNLPGSTVYYGNNVLNINATKLVPSDSYSSYIRFRDNVSGWINNSDMIGFNGGIDPEITSTNRTIYNVNNRPDGYITTNNTIYFINTPTVLVMPTTTLVKSEYLNITGLKSQMSGYTEYNGSTKYVRQNWTNSTLHGTYVAGANSTLYIKNSGDYVSMGALAYGYGETFTGYNSGNGTVQIINSTMVEAFTNQNFVGLYAEIENTTMYQMRYLLINHSSVKTKLTRVTFDEYIFPTTTYQAYLAFTGLVNITNCVSYYNAQSNYVTWTNGIFIINNSIFPAAANNNFGVGSTLVWYNSTLSKPLYQSGNNGTYFIKDISKSYVNIGGNFVYRNGFPYLTETNTILNMTYNLTSNITIPLEIAVNFNNVTIANMTENQQLNILGTLATTNNFTFGGNKYNLIGTGIKLINVTGLSQPLLSKNLDTWINITNSTQTGWIFLNASLDGKNYTDISLVKIFKYNDGWDSGSGTVNNLWVSNNFTTFSIFGLAQGSTSASVSITISKWLHYLKYGFL